VGPTWRELRQLTLLAKVLGHSSSAPRFLKRDRQEALAEVGNFLCQGLVIGEQPFATLRT